jgi:hypothetical protein
LQAAQADRYQIARPLGPQARRSGNGVPLLDATMVSNTGGGNTLMGNHGGAGEMNLFYGLDPTLETSDYNSAVGEQFVNC